MDFTQKLWERAYFPLFEGIVKGRSTARLYRASLETQWLDRDELLRRQLRDLNSLLEHAKRHVPFYRDDDRVPGRLSSLDQLDTLPILSKSIIREAQEDLLSDDPGQARWWKATGGSTGQPLRFAHTPLSHEWRTAMSLRGYAWAMAPPGSRQAYIWGVPTAARSSTQRRKEALHRWIERKQLYNCFSFTPDAMRECLAGMKRFRPDVIIAYTNAVYELARFIDAEGLQPPKVRAILCAAEKVHPTQRETIAATFGCDVFDTYGSREFMLIASECPEHHRLHVSMENLIVEVVDEAGHAVPAGETGRLLITDLHNFAMPFIRYEIGDLARRGSGACPCGRQLQVLDDIVGRSLDVIRTRDGRTVPGELIPHVMKDFPSIRRYQLVQEAVDDIRLHLVCEDTDFPTLKAQVAAKLDELIEGHLDVAIERVDHIATTPSGKHRVTVSRLGA